MSNSIPAFPAVHVQIDGHGSWTVAVQGITRNRAMAPSTEAAMQDSAEWIASNVAQQWKRPVRVTADDGAVNWVITVAPNGDVQILENTPKPAPRRARPAAELPGEPAPAVEQLPPDPMVPATPFPEPAARPAHQAGEAAHDPWWMPHEEPSEPPRQLPQQLMPLPLDPWLPAAELPGEPAPAVEQLPPDPMVPATPFAQPAVEQLPDLTSSLLGLERPRKRSLLDRIFGRGGRREEELARLIEQVRTPLREPHHVAVVCLKGGIGKTTTTAGVALTMAQHRGDRVAAIDANPDAGDLLERLTGRSSDRTISALARDADRVATHTDLSYYTNLADRLWAIGSDQNPRAGESMTAEEYERAVRVVNRFFSLTFTDCGTGVTHPVMRGVLDKANTVLIAAGYNASGAQRAARTIDWLHEHGYTGLSQSSIVVLTDSALKNNVDRDAVRHHFDGKASSLVEVPFDVTCSNGGVLRLDDVSAATRLAWLKIAAEIAARF